MLVALKWTDEDGEDEYYTYQDDVQCPPFVGSTVNVWVPPFIPEDEKVLTTRSVRWITGVVESVDFDFTESFSGLTRRRFRRYEAVATLKDVVTHCKVDKMLCVLE